MQAHKCHRVAGEHRPGFACLEDNLVIHLMIYLDPNSLLNLGRASDRLYHLACDKKVWRSLLKKVEEFTEDRVRELSVFAENSDSSQDLRQEVLREVADRLKEEEEELLLPDNPEAPKLKLSVSIPGWGGNPSIVQMDVKLRRDYAEVIYNQINFGIKF